MSCNQNGFKFSQEHLNSMTKSKDATWKLIKTSQKTAVENMKQ